MTGDQNIHSHTNFCDGGRTPEEMTAGAIAKGCGSFGFSGHSYAPFDNGHNMNPDTTRRYIAEINRLKEKYAGEIELFLGLEQEFLAEPLTGDYDFIINAIHYMKSGESFVCVDMGARAQKQAADEHFGGDWYAMAEAYYETAAALGRARGDVIAHFDLIAKYNFGGCLFDEKHPRYVAAALGAMEEILKHRRLFEVNTGAMYRFGKPEPYPSLFLLRELSARGGEVIITSDSHDTESICYKFDEIREMLKAIGFKYTKYLTKDGFTDVGL